MHANWEQSSIAFQSRSAASRMATTLPSDDFRDDLISEIKLRICGHSRFLFPGQYRPPMTSCKKRFCAHGANLNSFESGQI